MTVFYLLGVLAINIADKTPQVVGSINELFSIHLSGEEMFWYGFVIAFLIDLIFND